MNPKTKNFPFRLLTGFVLVTFSLSSVFPNPSFAQSVLNLPIPGVMVALTQAYVPVILKGVKIFPDNPLRFDFIVDTGDSHMAGEELKEESRKLIKYFLASLTVPEEDLWVNLSPYEKDRILPEKFGVTEMGKDLLAQDYLLKQLTASLIYPEESLGKEFWNKVYKKAYEIYGTTNIPINTFNKVWIVPDKAVVYQNKDTAFVADSHLKVMLEQDYLALNSNLRNKEKGIALLEEDKVKGLSDLSSKVVKEIILPEIEKEINHGKNFALLRQIHNSLILATWFKKTLKENILNKVYVNKNKVKGVDVADKDIKQKIYGQYLAAYKKGVYDYIKTDDDQYMNTAIERRYFSGGANLRDVAQIMTFTVDPAMVTMAGEPFSTPTTLEPWRPDLEEVGGAMDLASVKTVNTDTRWKSFVSGWNWVKAAVVIWRELVQNPEQPDSDFLKKEDIDIQDGEEYVYVDKWSFGVLLLKRKYVKNYKRNTIDMVPICLKFLNRMAQGKFSSIKEKRRYAMKVFLAKMNRTLLLGKDLNTFYVPRFYSTEEEVRQEAGKFMMGDTALNNLLDSLYEILEKFMKSPDWNQKRKVHLIGEFYYAALKQDVFRVGNNSLFMFIVNRMLRLIDLNGISHDYFDMEINRDFAGQFTFRKFFSNFVKSVQAANLDVDLAMMEETTGQSQTLSAASDQAMVSQEANVNTPIAAVPEQVNTQQPQFARADILKAIDLYAQILRDKEDQKTFRELLFEAEELEKSQKHSAAMTKRQAAKKLLLEKGSFKDFQKEPKEGIYPGGLGHDMFEMFPTLKTMHYINYRKFRVPSERKDLGSDKLSKDIAAYLQQSIYGRYVETSLQQDILGAHLNPLYRGVESFLKAEIEARGGSIRDEDVHLISAQYYNVYKIEYKNIFGDIKVIFYHERDLQDQDLPFDDILQSHLKARNIDLLAFKAYSGVEGLISKQIYDGLRNNGICISDDPKRVGPDAPPPKLRLTTITEFNKKLKKLSEGIGKKGGLWGEKGYQNTSNDYAFNVYRVVDFAAIDEGTLKSDIASTSPDDAMVRGEDPNQDLVKITFEPTNTQELVAALGSGRPIGDMNSDWTLMEGDQVWKLLSNVKDEVYDTYGNRLDLKDLDKSKKEVMLYEITLKNGEKSYVLILDPGEFYKNEIHRRRWQQELPLIWYGILMDIDLSITGEDRIVPPEVIEFFRDKLLNRTHIGLSTARPFEVPQIDSKRLYPDAKTVIDQIRASLSADQQWALNYLHVFVNESESGFNVGTNEQYDFGFQPLLRTEKETEEFYREFGRFLVEEGLISFLAREYRTQTAIHLQTRPGNKTAVNMVFVPGDKIAKMQTDEAFKEKLFLKLSVLLGSDIEIKWYPGGMAVCTKGVSKVYSRIKFSEIVGHERFLAFDDSGQNSGRPLINHFGGNSLDKDDGENQDVVSIPRVFGKRYVEGFRTAIKHLKIESAHNNGMASNVPGLNQPTSAAPDEAMIDTKKIADDGLSLDLPAEELQQRINKRLGVREEFVPMDREFDSGEKSSKMFWSRKNFGFRNGMSSRDRMFINTLSKVLETEITKILREKMDNAAAKLKAQEIAKTAVNTLVRYYRGTLDVFVRIGLLNEEEERAILLRKISKENESSEINFSHLANNLLKEDKFRETLRTQGVSESRLKVFRERMFPESLIKLYKEMDFSYNEIALVAEQGVDFVTFLTETIKPGIEYLRSQWSLSVEISRTYLSKRRLFWESLKENSARLKQWMAETGFTDTETVDLFFRLPKGLDLFNEVKTKVNELEIFEEEIQRLEFARRIFFTKGKSAVAWLEKEISSNVKADIKRAFASGMSVRRIAWVLDMKGTKALKEQGKIYYNFTELGWGKDLIFQLVEIFDEDLKETWEWWNQKSDRQETFNKLSESIRKIILNFKDRDARRTDLVMITQRLALLIMVKKEGQEGQFLDEIQDRYDDFQKRTISFAESIIYFLGSEKRTIDETLLEYDTFHKYLIEKGIPPTYARTILITHQEKKWITRGVTWCETIAQRFHVPPKLVFELLFRRSQSKAESAIFSLLKALVLAQSLGGLKSPHKSYITITPQQAWIKIYRKEDPVEWVKDRLKKQNIEQQRIDNMLSKIEELGIDGIKFDTVLKEDADKAMVRGESDQAQLNASASDEESKTWRARDSVREISSGQEGEIINFATVAKLGKEFNVPAVGIRFKKTGSVEYFPLATAATLLENLTRGGNPPLTQDKIPLKTFPELLQNVDDIINRVDSLIRSLTDRNREKVAESLHVLEDEMEVILKRLIDIDSHESFSGKEESQFLKSLMDIILTFPRKFQLDQERWVIWQESDEDKSLGVSRIAQEVLERKITGYPDPIPPYIEQAHKARLWKILQTYVHQQIDFRKFSLGILTVIEPFKKLGDIKKLLSKIGDEIAISVIQTADTDPLLVLGSMHESISDHLFGKFSKNMCHTHNTQPIKVSLEDTKNAIIYAEIRVLQIILAVDRESKSIELAYYSLESKEWIYLRDFTPAGQRAIAKKLREFSLLDQAMIEKPAGQEEALPRFADPKAKRGGIDLNPNNVDLEIKGGEMDVPMPAFDPAQLETMPIEGFYPVIYNIIPVTNLPLLLGTSKDGESQPADSAQEKDKSPGISFQKSPAVKEPEYALADAD